MKAQLYRIVRILEYTGTREMIDGCMQHDRVKGTYGLRVTDRLTGEKVKCSVKSAYIGSVPELLESEYLGEL